MIKFDSYKTEYKSPFGAIATNTEIKFCVKVKRELNIMYINLILRNDKSICLRLEKCSESEGYDIFCKTFSLAQSGLYHYRFELAKNDGTFCYVGTRDRHTAMIEDWLPEWKLTVYDENFNTTQIGGGEIMYQIFPDRFFKAENVDTSGAKNERIIHDNWYERPFCVYDYPQYKCNDYFMGNLKGVEQKLDYLNSLGVTHIYLNPIFESAENHRYCTSDYMNIDPYLGTTDDFISLCKKAHDYDMKIIIDGVFSHTGDDSIYFNKYSNYGSGGAYNDENSPYRNWYTFKGGRDNYECWWGFKTLPNVNETNEDYLEFITGKNGVLSYWLGLGADGFRLDVADELPDLFLEKLRESVKSKKPDAVIIGEVWENAVTKISYGKRRKFLLGNQCDTVMNYPFLNAIVDYVKDGNAERFYESVMDIVDLYPQPALKCLMNSLSTHDTARIINRLGAKEIPNRQFWADARLDENQWKIGIHRLMTAVVLQYTLPGVPCIYYADEAGQEGFGDPACRGTYPWGKENNILLNLYKELGIIRKKYAKDLTLPVEFIKHEGGVISFRRGRLQITANGSSECILNNCKVVWAYNYDEKIKPGGVIIEEMK